MRECQRLASGTTLLILYVSVRGTKTRRLLHAHNFGEIKQSAVTAFSQVTHAFVCLDVYSCACYSKYDKQ